MSRLKHYRFGHLVVDGREETRDVIVLPRRVVRNWWRKDGHGLVLEDLEAVLDELPSRLIVGTGATGQMRPDPSVVEDLRQRGIDVEVYRTDEAVRRYADADPATTAAALHLTC
ncbi:MAG TPA: MTH938/NDUFAF3 family protein [Actinomycetota bacterium]|nr:MTH938/NDUFAF3 family protein [Actinomycetota bacterium]